MMSYHKDPEVNSAIIRLLDALCQWERDADRDSTLLLIPHNREDNLIMAQGGKPIPTESITPEELFRSAMMYYRPEADMTAILNKAISAHPQAVILLEEKFPFLEVDEIAVLEEEFTRGGRPYPAYLMRKVLRHIKPNWEEAHPQYKNI